MEPVTIGPVTVPLVNPAIQPDQSPTKTSRLPVRPEFYAFMVTALVIIGAVILLAMDKTVPDAMWGIGIGSAGGGLGVMK